MTQYQCLDVKCYYQVRRIGLAEEWSRILYVSKKREMEMEKNQEARRGTGASETLVRKLGRREDGSSGPVGVRARREPWP